MKPLKQNSTAVRTAAGIIVFLAAMSLAACESLTSGKYLLEKPPVSPEPAQKTAVSRKEPKAPQKAKGPDQIYRQALGAYKKGDYDASIKLFATILEQYPNYSLADNSLYWTGECLYSKNQFEEAIAVFKAVEEKYPDGNKVPDALLKTGYAYIALDQYVDAIYFFKRIVMEHPEHPASEKAQKMLDRFKIEGRSATDR